MTTRVKGLKISQVPELKELTGDEMIPYQYNSTNGKIAVSTITDYVSVNVDPSAPSAEVKQLRKDVDKLTADVNTVKSNVTSILNSTNSLESSVNGLLNDVNNLESFANTKGQPNGIASLGSDGKLLDSQLPDGIKEVTYAELKAAADAGTLIPGMNYAITDYSCAYIMPEAEIEVEYPATDFKYIICTAISNNTLNEDVVVIREEGKVGILEAKYSIDPEKFTWTKGMTTKTPKGVFYYLKDENRNECNYDFKHIKFRRWAITNITANTTADTGSNTNVSPYRVYVNSNSRTIPDTRQFCGSSDPIEETLIPAIFEGKWRCGGETNPRFPSLKRNKGIEVEIMPYHDDYIKREIKPYTDTNYPADKYLAWQTDMYAAQGVSAGYYSSATFLGGLSNVTVNSNDYLDRYTFDCDGQDATEMLSASGNYPLVRTTSIIQTNDNIYQINLPNTVFAISKSIFDTPLGSTPNCYVRGNKLAGAIRKNTFLLNKANPNSTNCYINNSSFGKYGSTFGGNLLILTRATNVDILYAMYNYINGYIAYYTANQFHNNVLFGYYSSSTIESMLKCLLFGNDIYIKTTSDTNWVTSKDGEYWYANTFKSNIYSNIMGPCAYSNFEPHFNSNLFKAVYNKGVYFNGACLLCSYNWISWGVVVGYGGTGQGNYFGNMIHTNIPSIAFNGVENPAGKFVSYNGILKLNPANASKVTPLLTEVDIVSSFPADPHTMSLTITTVEHYPSTKDRHIIFIGSDGSWHLSNWKNVLEGTAGISTLALDDEFDEQSISVTDYAEMYRNMYPEIDIEVVIPED